MSFPGFSTAAAMRWLMPHRPRGAFRDALGSLDRGDVVRAGVDEDPGESVADLHGAGVDLVGIPAEDFRPTTSTVPPEPGSS